MDNFTASTIFPLVHGVNAPYGGIPLGMGLTLNIRQLRKERGLTLEQVAERIGVSVPHLSGVERGKKNLNNHLMTRLADALGVMPETLISDQSVTQVRLARILDQLDTDDRARVEAFAEALLRSQEASRQTE